MYDIISLKGLTALGTHGVYDFEQSQQQPFVVDIALWIDISAAAHCDELEQTVSYADVARDVCSIIEGPSVRLIETLASRIAMHLMTYPKAAGVQVVVHKPHAPMEQDFKDVSVTVRRGYTDTSLDLDDNHQAIDVQERSESVNESTDEEPLIVDVEDSLVLESRDDSVHVEENVKNTFQKESVSDSPILDVHSPDFPFPSRRTAARLSATDQWRSMVLAFGGNMGNVPETLAHALDVLETVDGLEITAVSPLLRTHAVLKPGMEPQDDHWNMVAVGRTNLDAHRLLKSISDLESILGRERPFEWAPRAIDIDIIALGEEYIDDEVLQIPHPRAYGRAFVLVPWLMVDPQAVLPGYGSVVALAEQAPDRFGIVDVVEDWRAHAALVMSQSDVILAEAAPDESDEIETLGEQSVQSAYPEDQAALVDADDLSQAVPHEASSDEPATAEAEHDDEILVAEPPVVPQPSRRNFAAEWDAFAKTVSFDTGSQKEEPDEPVIVPQLAQNPQLYVDQSADQSAGDYADLAVSAPVNFTVPKSEDADLPIADVPTDERQEKEPTSSSEERLYEAPSFDDVLASESLRPVEANISWIPVSATIPVVTEQDDATLVADREFISDPLHEESPAQISAPHEDFSPQSVLLRSEERPLPSWNFSRTPVTVIDNIDDVDSSESVAADDELPPYVEEPHVVVDESMPTSSEIILDPQLPEGTQVGIVAVPQTPAAGVPQLASMSRKSVFRPTHTGAIPVVKRSE